ncbi:hypothetical protein IFM89_006163 [Coptis chinensis]|uniref:Uncharacterized protein n=1 Tax=Coptis chinensis TaxID=261450 RepID=A0A835GV32_9MAGN|nr:hypothetical protein IFM89_006163 [Coptis chinensis]
MRARKKLLWVELPQMNSGIRRLNGKRISIHLPRHMREYISHKPEQTITTRMGQSCAVQDSPEHQVISERNKRNRSKQIAKHTSGEKIREEGAPPSQGDFFVLSHTSRKTNDALDGQSREYIEKMKELAGRDENGNQQPLSDEIYRQVMPRERHGRVRLMGRGVTPTSYFGSQASSHGTTSDRVAKLENEMAEMRRVAQEKEEERQHELDEIKRGFDA